MARCNDMTDLATVISVMEVTGALKGQSVCITGHLGRPRAEIVKIIKTAGGNFDERPRYGTTYMVTNMDWTKGTVKGKKSSKLQEAELYHVKIINEQTFYNIVMGGDTFATLNEAAENK